MSDKTIRIIKGLVLFVIFVGIVMMSYPTIADYWNRYHTSHVTSQYESIVDSMSEEELSEAFAKADAFNKKLQTERDRWHLSDELLSEYYETLDVSGTGILASVYLPEIGVNVPVYHGDADSVLQVAAGHMIGSSFPIGGAGCHAVIAAHTGMASAELFTKLDNMQLGDRFVVKVLNRQMMYEVCDIQVVLPEEVSYLNIDPEQDYVTLLTCTPRGVNSHRLLVKGVRVPFDDDSLLNDAISELQPSSEGIKKEYVILFGLCLFVIFAAVVMRRK